MEGSTPSGDARNACPNAGFPTGTEDTGTDREVKAGLLLILDAHLAGHQPGVVHESGVAPQCCREATVRISLRYLPVTVTIPSAFPSFRSCVGQGDLLAQEVVRGVRFPCSEPC